MYAILEYDCSYLKVHKCEFGAKLKSIDSA
jgi:hypothetical protein